MPVYLCQPGVGHSEPWRHGIQVYATPFPIQETSGGGGRDLVVASSGTASAVTTGFPIRRVRHAEIVLVDDVCIAFERYWLRLRWPGKGGFAGYIAMGLVAEMENPRDLFLSGKTATATLPNELEDRGSQEETDPDDPIREEEPQETGSMLSAEPFENENYVVCKRTGLAFQSSNVLRLLALYDDGVTPRVSLAPFPTEPVFCRICREGLHDDADEDQPTGGAAEEDGEVTPMQSRQGSQSMDDEPEDDNHAEPIAVEPTLKGPVQPHPPYTPNSHALENPILAPCECAGSMAFVHYLCVEQWRCRSRHPEACNGLNCETCGKAYALPPPSARPQVAAMDQEDWLDAMPPHVIQALRQPHLLWQLGAAIVRRRWLRPIAPVITSPIVSLYCRARRLLKKRGVARRRWACSLCRRRARWKCVRCLRSYYCSRQCQNVSWHIVHKHVCYKPARFWWSVVVYGAATLLFFPGILRDPLMFDMYLCMIPLSFVAIAFLAGGVALLIKKGSGVDLRGRSLELAVCLATVWLSWLSWGLLKGFFGRPESCRGFAGEYNISKDDLQSSYIFHFLHSFVFRPGATYYHLWDRLFEHAAYVGKLICVSKVEGECFEFLPKANADFFLSESSGGKCSSDILTVLSIYASALLAFGGGVYVKHRERERRRVGRRPVRFDPPPHLHQD